MSYCSNEIALLAGQIWSGIGAPSAQSVGYVSGWLMASGNVGDLNNRLSTDLSISGSCIVGMAPEEATIYQSIYNCSYYEGQSLATLAGAGSYWVSLAEADSRVTRSNMVDVSKAYLALHENAQKALYVQVANYKRRLSLPCAVDSDNLPAWPSP